MEGENQNANNTNIDVNGANNATDNNQGNKLQTFDEVLTNKEYQAEFDRRVQKAIQTHETKLKEQWKLEQDTQKSEAEKLAQMNETQKLQYQLKKQEKANQEIQKKLNARDLKDEALKIATTQDTAFDPEFLNLFDYENMTAEQLQDKTKLIKAIQDRIVEKAVNEWSKEKTPYNPDPSGNKSSADEAINKAMGLIK
nr:MAG TPA: capsid scaffolding protein [Caudoviricetes sp.]